MSVKTGDRKEGKLEVLDKARLLKDYTVEKLRSDKYFPKSTRWLYSLPLAVAIRECCSFIRSANSITVLTESDYKKRRDYQLEAHARLNIVYEIVDDAYKANYIDGHCVAVWTGLINDTEEKLKNWIKSDKERFYKV